MPAPTPTPRVSNSASGSTLTVPFPFVNALQARASLLGNAHFGPALDQFDSIDPLDLKAYPAWAREYPALLLIGSSLDSTPQTVSIYRNLLDSKKPGSATNPKVIVFTVIDDKGKCAAGAIRGFTTYRDFVEVDIGSARCNAAAAADVLRK